MAVRFLIAFILVSCGASAQVFQTNNVPYKFRGLKADSMLVVPSGADTANLANPKWGENMNGALFAKTGDSTLWMKVGTRWVKVSSTAITIDTTSLSNRINLKLNISDTAAMLSPYLRKADTASLSNRINLKVDSITSSNDSLYYYVNGTQYYVSSFTGFDTAVVVKAQVHNAEATTLLAGEVVYGFSSTGNLLSVKRANNKLESTSSKTFGIVRKDIPAGGIGWIVTNGVVDKLNLGAYTAGQEVYLDSINGQFTATKPLAPYNMVFVGIVERANAGNGQLYVKIQNGFELYELHNVSARFPQNGKVLKFRASDSLWTPQTDTGITSLTAGVGLTGGTITTTGTIAADTNVLSTRAWRQKGLDSLAALELSLADTAAMLTNYPRGTGAANQVTLWNGTRSLIGSNNFTFNNRRIGIGTSSPVAQLNIQQPTIDSNLTAINVSGYNLTGSNAQSAVDISGTWNTTGTPTLIKANVTNTASSINANLIDLQVNNNSNFKINKLGSLILNNQSLSSTREQLLTAKVSDNSTDLFGISNATITDSRFIPSFYQFSNDTYGALVFRGLTSASADVGSSPMISIQLFRTDNLTNPNNGNFTDITNRSLLSLQTNTKTYAQFFSTGNLLLQNGGTFTDNGFRLDVNGTGRFQNTLKVGAATTTNASAALDVESTTSGFLPPRMTAAQRTGIANAAGLLVWDSDSARYLLNNGTSWRGLAYTGEGGGGGGSASPGGTTYSIQYNRNGAFAGRSTFVFDTVNARVGIGTSTPTNQLHLSGYNTTNSSLRVENFEVQPFDVNNLFFGHNNYWNGTNYIYRNTGFASQIQFYNGEILFITFPSGTANTTAIPTIGPKITNAGLLTGTSGIADNFLALKTYTNNSSLKIGGIETQSFAVNNEWITSNLFYNGTNFVRRAAGRAHQIYFYDNEMMFRADVNGSANSTVSGGYQLKLNNDGTAALGGSMTAVNGTYTGGTLISTSNGVSISKASAPVASAALEITSTTKGFLQPVQTSTQRNAISTPASGLSVYNSTDKTNDVYDGTRWNNTPNGLKNSATLDFGSAAAQTSADLTITVTGAAEGDMVFLGVPNAAVNANSNYTAWVSATNTVTVRFSNFSSGAIDPASGTFRVYVIKN